MPLVDTQTPVEQSRVTVSPLTASGQPADIDATNPLRAELVSGPGRVVADAADPKQVVLVYGDAVGDTSRFRLVGDADKGAGVRELEDFVDGTIVAEEAANLGTLSAAKEPRV